MSTEINTRGMVRSKAPGFPAGDDNECLTKSEITITEKALVNGSYGDNECPVIDNVLPVKDIALGYVDANNKVHYIATLMNNPTFLRADLKNSVGDNIVVVIFIGYNNFMNAVLYQSTVEAKIGDIWIKVPCVDGVGSCSYNSLLSKIDDYSCYTEFLNFILSSIKTVQIFRFRVDVKDTSGTIIESSPFLNFALTD